MPTPTPLPLQFQNQIIEAGREIGIAALNQGIVSVFPLFFLTLLIIAIAVAIYIIRRPTQTAADQVNLTLANNMDKVQKQSDKKDEALQELSNQLVEAKKEDVEAKKALASSNESIAEAVKQVAAIQKTYVGDIDDVKKLLTKIDTVGSLPLQNAITSIGSLTGTVNEIKTKMNGFDSLFERTIALLEGAQETLSRVDRKIATQEIKKIAPLD